MKSTVPGADADEDNLHETSGLNGWRTGAAPRNEEEALRARHYSQELMLRTLGCLYQLVGIRLVVALLFRLQEAGDSPASVWAQRDFQGLLASVSLCLAAGVGLFFLQNWARHLALLPLAILCFRAPMTLLLGMIILMILETRGADVICSPAYRRILPLTRRVIWWQKPKLTGAWLVVLGTALMLIVFYP